VRGPRRRMQRRRRRAAGALGERPGGGPGAAHGGGGSPREGDAAGGDQEDGAGNKNRPNRTYTIHLRQPVVDVLTGTKINSHNISNRKKIYSHRPSFLHTEYICNPHINMEEENQ
jgi:hypothetical protein